MPTKSKERHDGRAVKVTTPSLYGSHASMIVKEFEDGKVICKDDLGEYTTHISRLDTGLADPHRWSR